MRLTFLSRRHSNKTLRDGSGMAARACARDLTTGNKLHGSNNW